MQLPDTPATEASAGSIPIKLGSINDLTDGTSNTTSIICSALNAIAPGLTENGQEALPDNIATTIQTIQIVGE